MLSANVSNATIWNIAVSNNVFTPSSLPSVETGDTIRWTLAAGSHNTTSQSVPGGAATWAYTFSGVGDNFDYKVTVAGTYTYRCTIHGASMSGSFVASEPAGIEEQETANKTLLYPNPCHTLLNVAKNDADELFVYDINGNLILKQSLTPFLSKPIDVSTLDEGVYFFKLCKEGEIISKEKIIISSDEK